MKRLSLRKAGRQRGSILVVTFTLCMVMALAALWMTRTLLDHQKMNQRRRDLNRAYFAAEAGVAQVLHWGNFPEEYDNLDQNGLFYRDPETGNFPNLTHALNEHGEYVIAGDLLATFASKYNFDVSNINEIVLIPPDPLNDPITCLFKVRSEGASPSGATRRILAYIQPTPFENTEIKLMAGLISLASASQAGNGRVHWGESWSKSDFNMLGKPPSLYLDKTDPDYDPFAKYRTEARIIFPSTWKRKKVGQDIWEELTRRYPGDSPASGNFANGFEQFIPPGILQWPDFLSLYDEFKEQAKKHGRYYSTDASGNIYKDGVEDADHLVDFDTEFAVADRETSPYDLVFIDTIDGNPPAADGSNLATVVNSGAGPGLKGVYWIGASYDQRGAGNPPSISYAEKPMLQMDGSVEYVTTTLPEPGSNTGVYLDGVLYAAGTMHYRGNPVVYGSVIAERGYLSGGTPDIYFNHKLIDGLEIPHGNVGSVFDIVRQKNF